MDAKRGDYRTLIINPEVQKTTYIKQENTICLLKGQVQKLSFLSFRIIHAINYWHYI